ncbi:hypothetical protein [Neptuniibacter sp. CAU 1671]|uniref:hypothetical protein n=1 Tax=Neptuniibacter sp. CAU 1671 TaxID=3032593 RepID=UPI0023DB0320|nr:hypothetical protein [Neptuniibacter sp. CAU 1671]MDF2182451.1 hypothetical protein [Neptuniibacter sp. CAU 1671]
MAINSSKTSQFIAAVQAALNIEMLVKINSGKDVGFLRIETLCLLDDAFDVAGRIPPTVAAHEAAMLFTACRLGHVGEEAPEYPGWLFRV